MHLGNLTASLVTKVYIRTLQDKEWIYRQDIFWGICLKKNIGYVWFQVKYLRFFEQLYFSLTKSDVCICRAAVFVNIVDLHKHLKTSAPNLYEMQNVYYTV